ncbi:SDR family oxidoreductase [Aquimarina sp. 2201CG1-2-11]|uniref:SDR family oxidoreductase n=1 Tax=Aquimarina discodermiae TaxID=3231043 RepID=UPI0034625E12
MKKIILITGGSRGIGKATSIELANQGYMVCINYTKDVESAKILEDRIKANGGDAISIKADISKESDVLKLFQEIDNLKDRGIFYGLVNNAGIIGEKSSLINISAERIRKIFDVNVVGTFLCTKEAIKRMTNGGSIVNISSLASKLGSPNEYIDYASTKGAIDTFTIGLSKEVSERNIRVNAIRPGFIETDIHKIPNRLEDLKSTIPMKRIGKPKEIAKVVVWLLSDDSSYTTGAIIDVTGGR